MDVTVTRGPSGMPGAPARAPAPTGPSPAPMDYPWWEHTHRFDLEPASARRAAATSSSPRNGRRRAGGRDAVLASGQALGSEPVHLEFRNPDEPRLLALQLGLCVSQPDSIEGIGAQRLRRLRGPEQRLRARRPSPPATSGRSCSTCRACARCAASSTARARATAAAGRFCVGRRLEPRQRLLGAPRPRARRRDLYDAAVYWHMAADEVAAHQAEEAAWMASIRGGTSFGTRLDDGPAGERDVQPRHHRPPRREGRLRRQRGAPALVDERARLGGRDARPPDGRPPNPPASWIPTFAVCHGRHLRCRSVKNAGRVPRPHLAGPRPRIGACGQQAASAQRVPTRDSAPNGAATPRRPTDGPERGGVAWPPRSAPR